jgi:hypothetical protein
MRTVLSTLVVAAMCGSASAQTAQSLGAPAGDPKRGERVYMEQLCYTCHGTLGQGGERGAHRDRRSAADARRARAAEHLVLLGHRPQPPRPRNAVAHRQRPLLILDDLPHLGGKPRGADGCRVEADGGRLLVALARRGRASRSCVDGKFTRLPRSHTGAPSASASSTMSLSPCGERTACDRCGAFQKRAARVVLVAVHVPSLYGGNAAALRPLQVREKKPRRWRRSDPRHAAEGHIRFDVTITAVTTRGARP